jgi:hypothetical protein
MIQRLIPLIVVCTLLLTLPALAAEPFVVEDDTGDISITLYLPETDEYQDLPIEQSPLLPEETNAVEITGFTFQQAEQEDLFQINLAGAPSEDAFYSVEFLEVGAARSRSPLVVYYSPDGSALATDGVFTGKVESIEPELAENNVIFRFDPVNLPPLLTGDQLEFHVIASLTLEKDGQEYTVEDTAGVEFEEPVPPAVNYTSLFIALGIAVVLTGFGFYLILKK